MSGIKGVSVFVAVGAALLGVVMPQPHPASAQNTVGHAALVPQRPRVDVARVLDGEVTDTALIGQRVVLAGTFTQVRDKDGTVLNQKYLMAYDQNSGKIDRNFNPVFDLPVIDVAVSADDANLFVVGDFTVVDGASKRKIAKLTATGALVTGFTAQADGRVLDVAAGNSRVYVGGRFLHINGGDMAHLAALDLRTGALDTTFNFPLTEGIGINGDANTVALDLTADRSTLMVAHTGMRIGGQVRVGVALITLGAGGTATLRPWRTRLYENALPKIVLLRISNAAISADGSFVIVTATGGDRPPTNDSVVRFSTLGDGTDVPAQWVSRHFDSVYAVAISNNAVYVGGHFQFQEAPGAPDPWPGDSSVNYGWGDIGGGAGVLAPFVVRREQIGALDPATGWALPWDPGTDAYHGIVSLTAVPNGLLVGGDMARLGGVNDVGRHGYFDFRVVPPAQDPQTSILAPINGEIATAGVQYFASGVGTASTGVQRVQVEVRQDATGLYLQADGSMGAAYYGRAATLSAPGATRTNWSMPFTLGVGRFTIFAHVLTNTGLKDLTFATAKVAVVAPDAQRPVVGTVTPGNGAQDFTSNAVAMTGSASDNRGVKSVQVEVVNALTLRHLQPNGTQGDFYAFMTTLNTPNAPVVTWNLNVNIPNGNWVLTIRATDIDGNIGFRDVTYRVFPNDKNPTITMTTPAPAVTTQAPGTITLGGTATDDSGIKSVAVYVTSLQTQNGVTANGTFGYRAFRVIPGIAPGKTSLNWTYTTPALPPGMYNIQGAVTDLNDKVVLTPNRNLLLQVPGNALPETTLTSPVNFSQTFTSTNIVVKGTATDGGGVSKVMLRVTRESDQKRLQPDGTFANRVTLVDIATLSNPGATSTQWSATIPLGSEDRYTINAYAVDNANQYDISLAGATATYLVFPSDADPQTVIAAPLDQGVITGTRIAANGSATDNKTLTSVELRIVNTATGQGPRIDGTIGVPQWVPALITNPGLAFSNWLYSSPVLPAGTYTVAARSKDGLLKLDLSPAQVTVKLQP